MATTKNGRKIGMFAALAKMLAPIAKLLKGKPNNREHHGNKNGYGRMAFYAISSSGHSAHRRNWAH